jgi:hypothetical protein
MVKVVHAYYIPFVTVTIDQFSIIAKGERGNESCIVNEDLETGKIEVTGKIKRLSKNKIISSYKYEKANDFLMIGTPADFRVSVKIHLLLNIDQ